VKHLDSDTLVEDPRPYLVEAEAVTAPSTTIRADAAAIPTVAVGAAGTSANGIIVHIAIFVLHLGGGSQARVHSPRIGDKFGIVSQVVAAMPRSVRATTNGAQVPFLQQIGLDLVKPLHALAALLGLSDLLGMLISTAFGAFMHCDRYLPMKT
jgi:hypothetical protein